MGWEGGGEVIEVGIHVGYIGQLRSGQCVTYPPNSYDSITDEHPTRELSLCRAMGEGGGGGVASGAGNILTRIQIQAVGRPLRLIPHVTGISAAHVST